MDKIDFLSALENALAGLPADDIDRSIDYYSEMIDDMTENGLSEEEAISSVGSLDEIVNQIITEIPITKLVKERIKKKRALGTFEIILLILGSPIWLSLLIAAIADINVAACPAAGAFLHSAVMHIKEAFHIDNTAVSGQVATFSHHQL